MKGRTVLAVDDDEMILALLEAVVTDVGGNFIGAHNAEECLTILQDGEPCMLVLDMQMDGMNGIELLERVRELYPKMKSFVLFLTAHKNFNLIERAKELGIDGFILKPIDAHRLQERLSSQFCPTANVD